LITYLPKTSRALPYLR